MLHGRAVIDLHNTKTHRDERIVHDNMLTNWIRDTLSIPIPLWNVSASNSNNIGVTMNAETLFAGLMMFRNALSNDADDYLFPRPSVNRMIAHADNTAYTGNDTTRGSYNAGQSSSGEGTITNVWDFTQEQGNGTISSLGLCHAAFGKAGSGQEVETSLNATEQTRFDEANMQIRQVITNVTNSNSKSLYTAYADYTNGKFYQLYLSASGILKRVTLHTPSWSVFNPVRSNWMQSLQLEYSNLSAKTGSVTEDMFDLSSVIGSVSGAACDVDNDGFLWILSNNETWGNGTSRTLVKFDIVNGTYTTQTVTNNTGVTLSTNCGSILAAGVIAIYDGILYARQHSQTNLYYINLTDNTDAGEVLFNDGSSVTTGPSSSSLSTAQRLFVRDGNLLMYSVSALAATTGSPSRARFLVIDNKKAYNINICGLGTTSYGANITGAGTFGKYWQVYSGDTRNNYLDVQRTLGLVTKNNLENAVTKTADMTMRVTYTVTDSAP